ncbi:MAG: dethiobiotin synthase [Thermodesulfovibrionales bacterium]
MPKGFFVTGTDTGVGKTVVSGALIRALSISGLRVCGMKPVESGCRREGDVLIPSDGMFLKSLSRADERIDSLTPCRFERPLAPMVAAEMAGERVDLDRVWEEFGRLSARYDAMVVEGVGGLLVPLRADFLVSDLALRLGLPLVVVASPFLGTINHTLLTVRHALQCGLKVAGVVINFHRPPQGTLAEETNPGAIARLSPAPMAGVVPHLHGLDASTLEGAAMKHLDLQVLFRHLG